MEETMRSGVCVLGASLLLLLDVREASAALRITDIAGREVTIARGPASQSRQAPARQPISNTVSTVSAGPDTSSTVNDYRRIQNALNAATSGDTLYLAGTFDFTQPFAAAAWALGNDGVAGTTDDFEVLVPSGLNNVTLTAISLGVATVQGPADLPATNLESFLVFDASASGASQGWTISNLRILDFDLSIGMFAIAAGNFDGTTIQNNFIRIPTDLNAVAAPFDTLQNIGIHFSYGTNQSILGNSIQIPGDGVSSGAALASSVAMQSNTTSVGSSYDGLAIANNLVLVLNTQSAAPEAIIGVWENGSAHSSDITVANNSFLNNAAGNDPSLNLQRAFRVTSHSGAASTVTYDSNHADGASVGLQWLPGT